MTKPAAIVHCRGCGRPLSREFLTGTGRGARAVCPNCEGTLRCRNCRQRKPREEFGTLRNGKVKDYTCRACRQRADEAKGLVVEYDLWNGPEPMGIAPNCDDRTRRKLAYPYHERQYRR